MTNKKKTGSSKRKEQAATKAVVPSNDENVVGPTQAPVEFTRAQLTSIIFLAMGAAKFMEWQRALNELLTNPMSDNKNTTTTPTSVCEGYLLTDEDVDYDSVCHNPVTTTMMELKYTLSCQLMLMALFLTIQCWKNDDMLNRVNAFLTITPISTTLLLLQSITSFLTPRKSLVQTCGCAILMFIAFPATGAVLREARLGNPNYKVQSGGWIISLALMSLIGLQLVDAWQWFVTTTRSGSPILAASTLVDWNDAWAVFMNTLMFDRFTMAALLTCVWTCLNEGRQRRFLLVWAVVQFYEYSVTLNAYEESRFEDLGWRKTLALTGSVVAGMAWFLPNMDLPVPTSGPKMKVL